MLLIAGMALAVLAPMAAWDARSAQVPGRLVLTGLAGAVAVATLAPLLGAPRPFPGMEGVPASLAHSLATGAVLFGLGAGLFRLAGGGVGGADVQVAGMLGILLGSPGAPIALVLALLSGAAYESARGGRMVRLVPHVALGALIALPLTPALLALWTWWTAFWLQ